MASWCVTDTRTDTDTLMYWWWWWWLSKRLRRLNKLCTTWCRDLSSCLTIISRSSSYSAFLLTFCLLLRFPPPHLSSSITHTWSLTPFSSHSDIRRLNLLPQDFCKTLLIVHKEYQTHVLWWCHCYDSGTCHMYCRPLFVDEVTCNSIIELHPCLQNGILGNVLHQIRKHKRYSLVCSWTK